jgi:hypothetical protein
MPLSMYQASVPIFVQLLGDVASVLDTAEALFQRELPSMKVRIFDNSCKTQRRLQSRARSHLYRTRTKLPWNALWET